MALHPRRRAVLALALALLLPARVAEAGNTDETLIGNDAALMAGAQTACGTSLHYNPAGLTAAESDSVDVSLSAYSLRLHSVSNLVRSDGAAPNDRYALEVSIIPTGATFVREVNERITLGLGVFTVQQSDFTFDGDATVDDGTDEMTYRLRVQLERTLYKGMFGIGWQPTPRFSLGFSVDLYYSNFRQAYLNDVTRTRTATASIVGGESYASDVAFDDLMLGASLGARLRLGDHATLGVAATLPGVTIATNYSSSLSWTYFPGDGAEGCDLGNGACHLAQTERSLHTDTAVLIPARFRAGFAWVDTDFQVEVDFDVQSAATEVSGLPRSATWNLRVGVMLDVNPVLSFGAGFFTDRSPYRETITPGDRMQDFYGLTAGLIVRKALRLAADEDSDALVFTTAISVRYAYGTGQILGLRVDSSVLPGADFPTQLSHVRTHEIALNLGSGVSF